MNDAKTTKFGEYAPTQFDAVGLGSEGQEDWIVLCVSQTRDSEALARSNFKAVLADLEHNEIQHEVHRFGHWGPGWFEIIIVPPDQEDYAEMLQRVLGEYPVFDEGALCEEEQEDQDQDWINWLSSAVGGKESSCEGVYFDDIAAAFGLDLLRLYHMALDRCCGGEWGEDKRAIAMVHTKLDRVWAGRPTDPRAFTRYRGKVRAKANRVRVLLCD
jgi:hypothetical protein